MSLKDLRSNPLMLTDDYNLSHQILKCNTDFEVSHIYNRGHSMVLCGFNEVVINTLDITITEDMVRQAEAAAVSKGEYFPVDLFLRLIYKTGGKLPLVVEALPDGTWVPADTPFAQVRNVVKGFGELVTWWEAALLQGARFCSQAATRALFMRRYLEETRKQLGYDESFLRRFHSFGFRGHNSLEDAYWAGIAWNLYLFGTDDFHTSLHTTGNYSSIAALAHKVVQQYNIEEACYYHAINAVKEEGKNVVALVIDTYNPYNFINNMAENIATHAYEQGVMVVFRPDSQDLIGQTTLLFKALCKDNKFVPGKDVAVIIGEDMSFKKAMKYDKIFQEQGIPLNFINYGIGEGFYADLHRSNSGWSMKTAYSNGAPRMKFTEGKKSIPGVVKVIENYSEDLEKELFCITQNEYERKALPGINQYHTIYTYNPNEYKVYTDPRSWISIKKKAEELITKTNLQKTINISKGIIELENSLRERYL